MAKKKSFLPKSISTVTPFSKALAVLVFFIFILVGMYIGMQYQKYADSIPSNHTAAQSTGTY